MKKLLIVSLIGLGVIMGLSAFAPVVPPVKDEVPLLVSELPAILEQLLVVFAIPSIGVLFGNIIKIFPFMKWMDGKTDKVVAFLVTAGFGAAVYLKVFNQDLLNVIMPWLSVNLDKYVQYINVAHGWVISIMAIPYFHKQLAGKFIVGRSFTVKK